MEDAAENISRPSGTGFAFALYPALKRWAIIATPLRGWDRLVRLGFFARSLFFCSLLASGVGVWGQSSSGSQPDGGAPASAPSNSGAGKSQKPDTSFPFPTEKPAKPDLSPPRSDRVNASDLGTDLGESSSKDTQIDVDAPENDARAHPKSAEAVAEEAAATGSTNSVGEFHPWNPHKAGKDVEVGDYYFKRKNYKAAEDRYREALFYKENDAEATFHLALCLQKMERPREALEQYRGYLKILPSGPHARAAQDAIDELSAPAKTRAAK
jgi:tetratricopeptide (TPR) repeat protein